MENGKLNFVSTKLVRDKTIGEGKIIGSKDEAISFMAEHLEDCDREYFVVLNLDAKLKVLNANIASIGGLDGVVIHPREIFKTSILSNARSVILFHNHPSGDPRPSKEDVDVTNRLIKAGKLLGIEVNDHIVIGDGKHISLRETEAANFYNIDEPNISELDEWDTLYERDKILKQEDAFSVERNIDGLPYKFDLSVDEISQLYEKLEQKQDLEFEKNEENKEMEYILVKQWRDDSFDEEFETKEDALKALDAEWYHLSQNDQKSCTSMYVLKSVQPNEEEEFHYDGDIVKAYKYDGHDYTDLENCPEFMRNDKDVVLDAVRYRADSIQFASEELRNDKDVVLEAVNRDGLVLEILSKEFQNDKDVILEAIKNDIEALEFASKEIKADKEFLLKAIKYGSDALLFASEEIKADKEFMFKAVKYNRWTLEFASDELQNDKEFLLKVIEVNPDCEELIKEKFNKEFQNEVRENGENKEIEYILVKQWGDNSFDEEFETKEDALKALDAEWYHLSKNDQKNCTSMYVLKSVQPNEDDGDIKNAMLLIKAYKYDGHDYTDLENCLDFMRNDKDVVLDAVRYRADSIQFASEELRNDKDVVLEAIKNDGSSLRFASNHLKNDKEVVLAAVRENGISLYFASKKLKNDKEVVLEAIRENGMSLQFASNHLKNDKEVVLAAVRKNGMSFRYVSDELKNDKEIILEALKENDNALEYENNRLRNYKENIFKPADIKKGDVIKTALGENTTVLEVEDNNAILFSGNQFIIASGIRLNTKTDKFEWSSGQYADDLADIANIKNKDFATMKETINTLSDMYHRDFVKSVVSTETGLDDNEALDNLYDIFISSDDMRLVSDEIYDLAKNMKELSNLNERCDMKIEI